MARGTKRRLWNKYNRTAVTSIAMEVVSTLSLALDTIRVSAGSTRIRIAGGRIRKVMTAKFKLTWGATGIVSLTRLPTTPSCALIPA
jgi:hypothetical protein